jgi:hypothetical protein
MKEQLFPHEIKSTLIQFQNQNSSISSRRKSERMQQEPTIAVQDFHYEWNLPLSREM